MAFELQRLIDELGHRLGRSVVLDDDKMRLLAFNVHDSAVDAARSETILRRAASKEIVDYAREHGAGVATEPFIVPPRPELGVNQGRIGVPIRHHQKLLGFLWLLETDGPLSGDHAEAINRAAYAVGAEIQRQQLLSAIGRSRERELARDLLSDSEDVRREAAELLTSEGLFSQQPPVALVVTAPDAASDQRQPSIEAALEFGRVNRPSRHALLLQRPDHGVLLLSQTGDTERPLIVELAEAIRSHVLESGDAGHACYVGIGAPEARLEDAHKSYAGAQRAATIASLVGVLGTVVEYDRLGVYGLLAELPPDKLTEGIHPGLRALLDLRNTSSGATLLTSVEVFLDRAGDVKRSSEELHVHRATLYYRLARVEAVTRLDLSNGDHRLTLHLGLKIARLMDLL